MTRKSVSISLMTPASLFTALPLLLIAPPLGSSLKRLGVSLSLAAIMLGCSQSPPAETAAKERAVEQKKEVLPPLQVVSAPKGLIAKARVANLAALTELLNQDLGTGWDMKSLILNYSVLGFQDLAKSLRLDSAIEMVAVLGSVPMKPPQWGWSIGVVGEDEVLAALDELQIPVMERAVGQFYFSMGSKFECVLGRSLGSSPLRLACATEGDDLHDLHDYQLRGLPGENFSEQDIYLELNFQQIRKVYAGYLPMLRQLASVGAQRNSTGHARFDGALNAMAVSLADDMIHLATDVESVSLSLKTDNEKYLFDASIRMQPGNSWLAQNLLDLSRRSHVAPERVQLLARGSDSYSYFSGLNQSLSQNMLRLLAELAGAYAEKQGATAQQSDELKSLFERLSLFWGESYSAQLTAQSKQENPQTSKVYAFQTNTEELTELMDLLQVLSQTLPKEAQDELDEFLPVVQLLKSDSRQLKTLIAPLGADAVYHVKLKDIEGVNPAALTQLLSRSMNSDAQIEASEPPASEMFWAFYQRGKFAEVHIATSVMALSQMQKGLEELSGKPQVKSTIFENEAFWTGAFSLQSLPLIVREKDAAPGSDEIQAEFSMKVASEGGVLHNSNQLLLPRAFVQTVSRNLQRLEAELE